jgi:threonine dehydrogenase-like Zn-dependent dehydrogenase
VRAGDQVTVDPSLHRGECYYCRRSRENLCERWAAIGVTSAGGAAEYAVAPVRNCLVLPESADPRRRRTTSSTAPAPWA